MGRNYSSFRGKTCQNLGERLGVPVLSGDELGESRRHALCILTPPEFHYIYAMKGIEAGKHVLVEKPVSFSDREIEEMSIAAKKNKVVCMPGHSYIYLRVKYLMKNALRRKKTGSSAYVYLSEMYYMPKELAVKYTVETDVLCYVLLLFGIFRYANADNSISYVYRGKGK